MTLVLPEPGPAKMSWKPHAVTASVCEGLRGIEQYLAGKPVMLFEKNQNVGITVMVKTAPAR